MIEIRNDGQGHDHLQEVFDAIWTNTNLRADIWTDMPSNPNNTTDKDNYRNKFTLLVADTNSNFYKFLYVK